MAPGESSGQGTPQVQTPPGGLPAAQPLSTAFQSSPWPCPCFNPMVGSQGAQGKGTQLDPGLPAPHQWVRLFVGPALGCSSWSAGGASPFRGGGRVLATGSWAQEGRQKGESRQQVPLLTALTGCQLPLKSRAHLRSSVGQQMGPGLIFLDSVTLGGR